MALVVNIAGVNRSSLINFKSLRWSNNTTDQASTMSFDINIYGDVTYKPLMFDEVTFYVDGVQLFGGAIVKASQSVNAGKFITYSIICKDYTQFLDRYLVTQNFENKPVINIINEILNRFVNKGNRVQIGDFENTEIWSNGVADVVNFRTGSQGWKVTASTGGVATKRDVFLNLAPSPDFTASDYIQLDVYIEKNFENIDSILLRFYTDGSNYYSADISSQILANGWNTVRIQKSAFAETGVNNWNAIEYVEIISSTSVSTVNITFDNFQVYNSQAFTALNSLNATHIVNFISFKYEQPSNCLRQLANLLRWAWFVDFNRDVNFFPKFEKSAPFSLDDTSGNFIFNSLKIENDATQVRNSIFVKGSEYLASVDTASLDSQADGDNKNFLLPYRYANYSLTQNSVELSVGLQNFNEYANNDSVFQNGENGNALTVGEVAGNSKQAQQVICTAKGRRGGVRLKVRKVGNPVDNFLVEIFADSGNKPTGATLSGLGVLSGASITSEFVEYLINFDETSPESLLFRSGDKYHIQIARSSTNDASNYYEIAINEKVYDGISNTWDGTSWNANNVSWYFFETLDFDVLYNFQEKTLVFNTAPTGGDVIDWTAQPYLNVLIRYKDYVSISEFGEYETRVFDKSIQSKNGARQRALAEVLQYGEDLESGGFQTYKAGLRAGQTISIDSDVLNINESYLIKKVSAKARNASELVYSVNVVSTKIYSIIDWLRDQIDSDSKDQDVDENDLIDQIEGILENLLLTDSLSIIKYDGKVWSNDAGTTPNALVWSGGALDIWI